MRAHKPNQERAAGYLQQWAARQLRGTRPFLSHCTADIGRNLPYPGEIVRSHIERDEDDGLKYSVRMHKNAALWKVGDRLQSGSRQSAWHLKRIHIYTRNFVLTFPINKWLRDKAKKRGVEMVMFQLRLGQPGVADQTFINSISITVTAHLKLSLTRVIK